MITIYRLAQIHGLPEVVFAHHYSTSYYNSDFGITPNRIEFTLNKHGDLTKTYIDGSTLFIPQNSISVTVNNQPFNFHSHGSLCSHHTFAIEMDYSIQDISEEEIQQVNHSPKLSNEKYCLYLLFSDYIPLTSLLIFCQ